MILYPKIIFNKVEEINIEFLNKNKLKALILDVDNTLIDTDKNLSDNVVKWARELKGQGVKLCILSNSHRVKKVKKVAEKLNIENYLYFAKKPFKKGFIKIQKILNMKPENIGVVGDQIFTDIWGGNRCVLQKIGVR